MRIAMLQADIPPASSGGVGHQVLLLARGLIRRGHQVTIFSLTEPPGTRGLAWHRVELPSASRLYRVVGVAIANRRLDLSGFDVVHAHGDDWLFGRRPRVRTFHGTALMEARTAASTRRRLSQLVNHGFEWVSSFGPCPVAVSGHTRRHLPLVRDQVPNAVDTDSYFPGGTRDPRPSVLFVAGTLGGRKRGRLVLEAFAQVRASRPDARLTLVCPEEVRAPGVRSLGNLSNSALGDLYRSHWVLCSASAYEGFGIPYAEAMACGLPVITTRNPGATEVLDGGRLGVLCEPHELADTLARLLDDEAERARLSALGLEAAASFSLDSVAARYEQLYGGMAARIASWPTRAGTLAGTRT